MILLSHPKINWKTTIADYVKAPLKCWEPPKFDGTISLQFYHNVKEDVLLRHISAMIFKTNMFEAKN